MTMPWPAVTVADMIESLSQLPADAPLYLIEVQQEWLYSSGPAVTTLTLKCYGDLSVGAKRRLPPPRPKALPSVSARIDQ